MQKIVIIIFVFFSVFARADDKDVIYNIEQIQKFAKSMSTSVTDPLCANCSKEQLLNQCTIDICAKGKIHTNTNQMRDQSILDALLKLKDPKIRKIYDNLATLTKDMIFSGVKKYSARLDTTKKLVDSNAFSENKDQIKTLTIYNLLDIWARQDTKNLTPYLKLQVQRLSPAFTKVINDNYNFYSNNPDIHYKLMYPNLDTKQAMLEDLKKFDSIKESLLSSDFVKFDPTVKTKIKDFYKSKFYQDLISGKDVNVSDASEMLNETSVYGVQLAIFKDPYINLIKKDLDIDEINKAMHSKDMKSKMNALNNELVKLKTNPKEINNLAFTCASNFLGSYLSLPTKDIDQTLNQLAKELKNKMNDQILSQLSDESRKKLQFSLDSWYFETKTNDEYLNELTSKLKNYQQKNLYDTKLLENLSTTEKTDLESVKLHVLSYSSETEANTDFLLKNVFPELKTVCLVDLPSPGSDMAYSTNGGVVVSWGSLKDLNIGRAVLSHEFGHLLSHDIKTSMLSKKTKEIYENTMECLQKNHKNYKLREESFADLISAMMEGPQGNNFGCYFSQKFSNDPIIEKDNMDHPQVFSRLLNIETVMRGSLPETCRRYMELAPTKTNFNSCWSSADQ